MIKLQVVLIQTEAYRLKMKFTASFRSTSTQLGGSGRGFRAGRVPSEVWTAFVRAGGGGNRTRLLCGSSQRQVRGWILYVFLPICLCFPYSLLAGSLKQGGPRTSEYTFMRTGSRTNDKRLYVCLEAGSYVGREIDECAVSSFDVHVHTHEYSLGRVSCNFSKADVCLRLFVCFVFYLYLCICQVLSLFCINLFQSRAFSLLPPFSLFFPLYFSFLPKLTPPLPLHLSLSISESAAIFSYI